MLKSHKIRSAYLVVNCVSLRTFWMPLVYTTVWAACLVLINIFFVFFCLNCILLCVFFVFYVCFVSSFVLFRIVYICVFLCTSDSISRSRVLLQLILNKYVLNFLFMSCTSALRSPRTGLPLARINLSSAALPTTVSSVDHSALVLEAPVTRHWFRQRCHIQVVVPQTVQTETERRLLQHPTAPVLLRQSTPWKRMSTSIRNSCYHHHHHSHHQ